MRFHRFHRFHSCLLPLLAFAALCAACSDDESTVTELPAPAPEVQGDYSSLTFSWQPVEGATQYGYQLTDPAGAVVEADVTRLTTLTFPSLKAATTYTLEVWAYGPAYSSSGTSPVATLQATTQALLSLPAPVVTVSSQGTSTTVSWTPVEGAQQYSYALAGAGETRGTTTDTVLTFRHLDMGHYTATIRALVDQEGYEPAGEPARQTFQVTVERQELWRVDGTYESAVMGTTHTSTLVAYDDDSYVLLGWYGVEGYDLDFDRNGQSIVLDPLLYPYDAESGCNAVPTGQSVGSGTAWLYTPRGFSYFKVTSTLGRIRLCQSYQGGWPYDFFEWDPDAQH